MRLCDVCGEELGAQAPGHTRRHAGECHREHERRRRREGYRSGRHRYDYTPRGPWRGARTCRVCGGEFLAVSPRASVCYEVTCKRRVRADRGRIYTAARKALRVGATTEPFTPAELGAAWDERGLYSCVYCDAPFEHVDHAIPLSLGGAHAIGNLVPACAACNTSKGATTAYDFAVSRGLIPA